MRPCLLSLVLLGACVSDNNLSGEKTQPSDFDSGSEWVPPEDTSVEEEDTDTGVIIIPDETCDDDDLSTKAYTIPTRTDCEAPPETTPDWTLASKWTDPSIGMMLSTVVIGQLDDDNGDGDVDNDDEPDLVAAPYSGFIRAYNADGSTKWQASSSNIEQSTPAIGDLDGDGKPEVVVGGLSGSLAVHGEDGSAYWSGPGSTGTKQYCGTIGIADLDEDGDAEVYTGRVIINGQTGATLASGSLGYGSSISGEAPNSVAADIDLDGDQEVVVGNAAYSITGASVMTTGDSDGFPAVANMDSDPEGEVIVAQQGKVSVYNDDGSLLWTTATSSGYSGPPAVADFDGDGEPEIAVPISPGVIMLDTDGTKVWTWAGTSTTFFDGVSAYDLDGNGEWEVLHVSNDGLHIIEGHSGDLLSTLTGAQSYCGQMPVVADLDGDGHVDMAFGTYNSGVYVMEDAANGFTAGFKYWNQGAFSITNINDDMSIPTTPDINWAVGYNNFRAGPPVEAVFPNQNIVGKIQAICVDECDNETVTISYSLGNDGTEDITDVVDFEIWGDVDGVDTALWTSSWTAGLRAGYMEASTTVELVIPGTLRNLTIKVDGGSSTSGSKVMECDETDNETMFGIGCI
ncbi:hypothetical protein LBMAG42_47740 [Deltaproteobacteria bacterium]|nr:hypothetical protein LBMAG42_47740 [Deltaproteobacteria bacterium]